MKKNTSSLLSIAGALLFLSSCTTYLAPAILGNNVGYQPRPMAADSIRKQTYITGSYGASESAEDIVTFQMGMLNVSRSQTFKSFNISYGAFGFLGKADYNGREANGNVPLDDSQLPAFNKTVSGLGLRTSIGYHISSTNGNTDFRLLNWENSLSKEMGAYANFRKDLLSNGNRYDFTEVSDKTILWTTGLSTEIIFRSGRTHNFKHAFRLFLGYTPGLEKTFVNLNSSTQSKDDSSTAFAMSYYMQFKKFSFAYQVGSNINIGGKISVGYLF